MLIFRYLALQLSAALVVMVLLVGSAFAQDVFPGRGPGASFDLCPFLSQERAEQLVGQSLERCHESGPGWVRQATYVGRGAELAGANVVVTDKGTPQEALELYEIRRTVAGGIPGLDTGPLEVSGVGDQGFFVTNDRMDEVVIRRGQYLVYVAVTNAQVKPSINDLAPIAAAVVAAL